MTESQKNSATPAPGEVIGRSVLKTLAFQVFSLMLFFFGLFLVWAWWTDPLDDRKVTWWGLIIGIGCILFSPLFMVLSLYRLVKRERLILGADRLQVVRRLKGEDVVILQIPYGNIGELSYEVRKTDWFVGINLLDLNDPDTFGEHFESKMAFGGWHYKIGDGYKVKAARIYKKLEEYTGLDPRTNP